jgi:DNA-binding NarL/FixJ family response regulator
MYTAVLADDHIIVRDGIKSLLEESGRLSIIGEASDGQEAFALVRALKPDLLITDITMPKLSGLELAQMVQQSMLKTKVLIFTMHENEGYILRAFENGALGYLLKDAEREDIFEAIDAVVLGERYYGERASRLMMQGIIKNARGEGDEAATPKLSKREVQVLKYVVEGHTSGQIAAALFISARTVDSHRTNIMQKLKVKNTAELVKTALQLDLLD